MPNTIHAWVSHFLNVDTTVVSPVGTLRRLIGIKQYWMGISVEGHRINVPRDVLGAITDAEITADTVISYRYDDQPPIRVGMDHDGLDHLIGVVSPLSSFDTFKKIHLHPRGIIDLRYGVHITRFPSPKLTETVTKLGHISDALGMIGEAV